MKQFSDELRDKADNEAKNYSGNLCAPKEIHPFAYRAFLAGYIRGWITAEQRKCENEMVQLRRVIRASVKEQAGKTEIIEKMKQFGIEIIWGFCHPGYFPPNWTVEMEFMKPAIAINPSGERFLIGTKELYPWIFDAEKQKWTVITDSPIPRPK